jgi:hypothetical protein
MGTDVRTIHGIVVERIREVRALDIVTDVHLGLRYLIKEVNSPVGPKSPNPVDDVALHPGGHVGISSVPERPDILVGGDRMPSLKPCSDLLVTSKIEFIGVDEL